MAKTPMIILYVADQQKSKAFYELVLERLPLLDVPGMTEFELTSHFHLGLMPEKGISKILCPNVPNPAGGNGIPRCELYLFVDDPAYSLNKAIKAGAVEISKLAPRDWGDNVAYCADPDGHIIAFAK